MHNIEKSTLRIHTTRFSIYVWSFFNIKHERVNTPAKQL